MILAFVSIRIIRDLEFKHLDCYRIFTWPMGVNFIKDSRLSNTDWFNGSYVYALLKRVLTWNSFHILGSWSSILQDGSQHGFYSGQYFYQSSFRKICKKMYHPNFSQCFDQFAHLLLKCYRDKLPYSLLKWPSLFLLFRYFVLKMKDLLFSGMVAFLWHLLPPFDIRQDH